MIIINMKGNVLRVKQELHFTGGCFVCRKRYKTEWMKRLNI